MGYLHINNLYMDQTILLFKQVFALEKIHGTSASLVFEYGKPIEYSPGCVSPNRFKGMFNEEKLLSAYSTLEVPTDRKVTIYGEAYGGRILNQNERYGNEVRFSAFDVQIGEVWLKVQSAEEVCLKFGIEFVPYVLTGTSMDELNAARDADSVQAFRNGFQGKKTEGVVLRPLVEMRLNNDNRVICKHKRDEFKETATSREVEDPAKLKVLADAEQVATEWVTPARLEHVLSKLTLDVNPNKNFAVVVKSMVDDVMREGILEIVDSKAVRTAIGKRAASLYKTLISTP